ncbi:glycolate oxidase subunit GlcE [Novosphingobium sp. TH158]|uniref:glycolate oxidase subunit GlcE n=1 Tax=Novosphingobium sp. TH158 TaxID=2067455 RepID=UPI000C7CD2DF|nr:glycolate oxidase subunit GlcE [Novosphingobium sp. TH158]PLK26745.1 glycolate oxidase subunit GlcE [Novosphingobium sp. TH158]
MTPSPALRPATAAELVDLVMQAAAQGTPLECHAGGSKRNVGNPARRAQPVDLGAFAGIVDYEPSELVLTVRPATPLAEVEALLAANGQMLAFEPWDAGALFSGTTGKATIGGTVGAGIAGPRRLTAGGARDHLLGFHAVSGRGEAFKAGGKVVKNVTGYDLAKLMAGSWGQLAIMTELSLKVLPAPRSTATVVIEGLSPEQAVRTMSAAVGSQVSPVAAAYLPAQGGRPSQTCLRLEGFAESVALRRDQLAAMVATEGLATACHDDAPATLWQDIREAAPLRESETLWRAHLSPSRGAALAEALDRAGADWLLDWAGGLAWIGAPAGADIRALVAAEGGHAMLMRGPDHVRSSTPIRHPEAPALAGLSQRVRRAFDPAGILDPERWG